MSRYLRFKNLREVVHNAFSTHDGPGATLPDVTVSSLELAMLLSCHDAFEEMVSDPNSTGTSAQAVRVKEAALLQTLIRPLLEFQEAFEKTLDGEPGASISPELQDKCRQAARAYHEFFK